MLQKMGHLSSRVAFKMMSRRKCHFPGFPEILKNHGQSIGLQQWPNLIANRGSKLTKSWAKSPPQEET